MLNVAVFIWQNGITAIAETLDKRLLLLVLNV
jgi:hypothetical protein